MNPPHSVALLSAPPILNLMGMMQSKCAPSQAFLACCPLQSLPKLHLRLLPRSSSGYILCSSQEIKYKRETITTFRIPSTPFCPKAFQNSTDDMVLSCLYDDAFPHQVLPIKDDASPSPLPSRIFFHLPLSCS